MIPRPRLFLARKVFTARLGPRYYLKKVVGMLCGLLGASGPSNTGAAEQQGAEQHKENKKLVENGQLASAPRSVRRLRSEPSRQTSTSGGPATASELGQDETTELSAAPQA